MKLDRLVLVLLAVVIYFVLAPCLAIRPADNVTEAGDEGANRHRKRK